jgi:hypothetical protein
MSLLDQIIDFEFNRYECLSQRAGDRQVWIKGCETGAEYRAMQAREEESDFAAIGRDEVAV